jgi:hypothetical protein
MEEKKRMMGDCELSGKAYEGQDLLSLRLCFTLSPISLYSFDCQ